MDRRTKKVIFLGTVLPLDDIILSTLCGPPRFCSPIDHSMIYCSWCWLKCCRSFLVQQITVVHCLISRVIQILGRCSPTYLLKASSDAYHEPGSQECKSNTQSPLYYSGGSPDWPLTPLTAPQRQQGNNSFCPKCLSIFLSIKIISWKFWWIENHSLLICSFDIRIFFFQ